jgi:7-carboxy-7-deazaguanine synthase
MTKPKHRDWYQVNEIFTSVQGEGVLTGRRATFIRLQGCTVGCHWCDSGPLADAIKDRTNGETGNTWGKGGQRMTVDAILAQVQSRHVIITGGEPTIWDLDGLIAPLKRSGVFVQLETSGQNDLKGEWRPDWITWSPKMNLNWDAPTDIKLAVNEVKWVIEPGLPFAKLIETWDWLEARRIGMPEFVLMPEGCPPHAHTIAQTMEYLERVATDAPFIAKSWRFGDRLQYRLGVR